MVATGAPANNWLGGTAPVANDALVFADLSTCCSDQIGITNDFAPNTAFDSLTFSNRSTMFSGFGNAVNLGAGGLHQEGATVFANDIPLVLTASQTWTTQEPGYVILNRGTVDLGPNTLTITGSGHHLFLSTITGTGGITLSGSSLPLRIHFQGDMSYTGVTTVGANAWLHLATSRPIRTPIVVASGGFLSAIGGMMNAPLTISAGGTYVASNTISVNSSPITLGGNLDASQIVQPLESTIFTIIANNTGEPVSGTFAGLPEGATFTTGAKVYRISYHGGTGQDVTVTVVGRATPATTDMNIDGKSDVLWRQAGTPNSAFWLMNGTSIQSASFFPPVNSPSWTLSGSGDFDGDGKWDLIWIDASTGQVVVWLMYKTQIMATSLVNTLPSTDWKLGGVGDFDGNTTKDLIWRNVTTGEVVVWLMSGGVIGRGVSLPSVTDLNWNIAGVGDFDGSGKTGVFWRNAATGENVVWLIDASTTLSAGSVVASAIDVVPDTNYRVAGVGDLDGDGKADLVWWNQATGDVAVWLMNGASIGSASVIFTVSNTSWHPESVGDFDGDGKADVLWRNVDTGDVVVWLMDGPAIKQAAYVETVSDPAWSIVAPR